VRVDDPLIDSLCSLLLYVLSSFSSHFLKFLFMLSLLGHAISSIGLLLGCLVHVPIIAVMLCPLTVIPFMLTSGFFINLNTIPSYLAWITVLSPHRYTFAGLMGLEFIDLKLHCDQSEMVTVLLSPQSKAPQPFQYCSMILGRQVLDLLSLPHDEYWHDIGALIILSLVFRVLALGVLTASVRENQIKLKAARKRATKYLKRIGNAAVTGIMAFKSSLNEAEDSPHVRSAAVDRDRDIFIAQQR
jgi:hypothetical protein